MPKRLRITGLPDDVNPVLEILKQNGYDVSLYSVRRDEDSAVISYELKPKKDSVKNKRDSFDRKTKS